jgi:hypothetical protein
MRQNVPPKHLMTFNELHGIISQKIEHFIPTAVRTSNPHLSDNFPIQHSLKQGDALTPLLFNPDLKYAIREVQENQVELNQIGHISYWSMLMM